MTDPFDHGRESDTRALSLDGMDHADMRVKYKETKRGGLAVGIIEH